MSAIAKAINELIDAKLAFYDAENNPKTRFMRGGTIDREFAAMRELTRLLSPPLPPPHGNRKPKKTKAKRD